MLILRLMFSQWHFFAMRVFFFNANHRTMPLYIIFALFFSFACHHFFLMAIGHARLSLMFIHPHRHSHRGISGILPQRVSRATTTRRVVWIPKIFVDRSKNMPVNGVGGLWPIRRCRTCPLPYASSRPGTTNRQDLTTNSRVRVELWPAESLVGPTLRAPANF